MSNILTGDQIREALAGYHEGSVIEALAQDYVLIQLPAVLPKVEWSQVEGDEDEILVGGMYKSNWNKFRVNVNVERFAEDLEIAAERYVLAIDARNLVQERAKERREEHVSARRADLVEQYGYPSFVEAPEAVQDLINKLAEAEYTSKLKDKDLW